ncbi:hypothetical protein E2562_011582 [Oryza meyeriana var. granulata]|uniref:Uncharacterized protein n=1 Tax=Oryza meyeriana var. granulata TaxID=110450 RepID=A0A6G1DWH2_9ORYZ|nr:hypothetical protein E2562_011582 [Oryza meyeriana var. granulata]
MKAGMGLTERQRLAALNGAEFGLLHLALLRRWQSLVGNERRRDWVARSGGVLVGVWGEARACAWRGELGHDSYRAWAYGRRRGDATEHGAGTCSAVAGDRAVVRVHAWAAVAACAKVAGRGVGSLLLPVGPSRSSAWARTLDRWIDAGVGVQESAGRRWPVSCRGMFGAALVRVAGL